MAEVVYAHQVLNHELLKSTTPVDQPNLLLTPLWQSWASIWLNKGNISLFDYRMASLIPGVLLLLVVYVLGRLGQLRKYYAHALLLLLCMEPGLTPLLHAGSPDALALLFTLLSFLVLFRRAVPGYVHYVVAGLLAGAATLSLLPYFWLGLMLAVWLFYQALKQRTLMSWLGTVQFAVLFMVMSAYPVWAHSGASFTLDAWWQALNNWHVPATPVPGIGIWQGSRVHLLPWHYALFGAGVITVFLFLLRSKWQLPRLPALGLFMAAIHFVLVSPHTGNTIAVLPFIYLVLFYMIDFLHASLGPLLARPMPVAILGSNVFFSATSVLLVMSSLGGRDYAMADYELNRTVGQKPATVVADARYYFSVVKTGANFVLYVPDTAAAHLPMKDSMAQHTYFLVHEDLGKKYPKALAWAEHTYGQVKKAHKLRSYIDMPFLNRSSYGWVAQRNQMWQMNYDGILFIPPALQPNSRR